MTPINYDLDVSITRRKSRHLKKVPYTVNHTTYELLCTESQERDLLPGQTYRVRYGWGSRECHTFKITANTKYGEIESNEIYVPYDCKEIAMEIITERGRGNNYSLTLAEVTSFDESSC